MISHLSVGVIGHVDHGKTSLVKALSGMDTDRLKEEKERGMSIVLGFAHLDDGDAVIDLIDVPGHENFIRTMVAGATGIDAALLVVDAMEGVKPQTEEHLAIAEMIGVQSGVIALTKCDLADDAQRTAVVKQLRSLLKGSGLACAPLLFTSAASSEGLEELKQALKGMVRRRTEADAERFYLPIDRSFSMPGHGTVATGTLRLGCMQVGDEVELMPGGMRTTVRQLQFHGRSVDKVFPGQRVGVNLRHLSCRDTARGMAIASPGLLQPSTLLDAELTILPGQRCAVAHGQQVRLLFGTTDVPARVRCLAAQGIEPGQSGYVQLQVQRPVAALANEAFILRRESPPATLGGGRVLDAKPSRHRHADHAVLEKLQVLAHGSMQEKVAEQLKLAGYAGIAVSALAAKLGMAEAQARTALEQAASEFIDGRLALYRPHVEALADMLNAAVVKYHRQYPVNPGAPLAHCRACLPKPVGEALFRHVLHRLCAARRIEIEEGLARSYGYDPLQALSEPERKLVHAMEERIRDGGLTPPDIEEVVPEGRMDLLHLLAARGRLLLIPGEQPGRRLVFHWEAVCKAEQCMRQAYPPPAAFTVSELRARLGSTRKFIVPLLEYFDAAGHTQRRGDKRVVGGKAVQRR